MVDGLRSIGVERGMKSVGKRDIAILILLYGRVLTNTHTDVQDEIACSQKVCNRWHYGVNAQ